MLSILKTWKEKLNLQIKQPVICSATASPCVEICAPHWRAKAKLERQIGWSAVGALARQRRRF